ncbi:hypothetical protein CYMTET_10265 [Cymbomonas tetramitiformis]|uniref:Uncharacterized protein n=1 Tax=Cymbomonas tetramitiformis TaxID=36881 RepID=A0AAE0GPH5_9CHLO|nr:hypothetical protein CYMTET_10265 [Cymbomonas tetramitiformis]
MVGKTMTVTEPVSKKQATKFPVKKPSAVEEAFRIKDVKLDEQPPVSSAKRLANLDAFFAHTTPLLSVHRDSKVLNRGCGGLESTSYFHLSELWASFEEWSAYGAEVPLVLESGEEVLQYYVPYLSALQLYRPKARTRQGRCDSSSEENYDSSDRDSEDNTSSDGDSLDSCSDEGKGGGRAPTKGKLCFEFLECAAPYTRSPLSDKVAELTREFPDLMHLRSNELHPCSWIAVAWYPIYRIPTGRTLRDLSACFLTYHSLTLPPEDQEGLLELRCPSPQTMTLPAAEALDARCAREAHSKNLHALRPFGCAAYKLRGEVWNAGGGNMKTHQKMHQAAIMWLSAVGGGGVECRHPDFEFFHHR